MALSIHTNASAKTAINSLSNAGLANAKSSQRLSTGFRINSPADNAAGLQITNRMEKFLNGAGQAKQNIQESIAMLQIADGGLAESVKTLNAMKKLATQAANDTNSAADREAIQKEFTELGKELQNALNNTEYNSEKLFADGGKMRKELNFQSGTDAGSSLKLNLNDVIAELTESVTKPGTAITADASGTPAQKELARLNQVTADALREKELAKKAKTDLGAVQAGANATANIDIPEYKDANGQTVLGKRIASGATVSAGDIAQIDAAVTALTQVHTDADKASTDYANNNLVGGGVMNMRLADKDLAMEADKKLSEVIDAYGAFRATLGANQNRLQSSSNNLDNMISNTAQALGSIKDTDFADEMKNHAQSEMLMQSSVMMLKKANAATQLISTLLQG
ncbi:MULTISPECIES: flagellin N-terminal helical domain-containing protein [Yersinia pseudotuberculosis complex]|uniref:Flagellin n=3 Tax=Yersinia pseudotuberculosis TaxID=633 RepID=A0A0U1R1T4_YERP3|nr:MULTISPECIES: flagellin [Yersinia pseudotuberculosis complex]ABS49185.1 flagellin [Yersinia pseudotuberculosis IP 31758]MCE4114432.1 flagellin [Yersinia pseudotuberculosis]MCF1164892.1 flagellin [Yersinia pseudotuberculosis]UFA60300.1 Flagellin protein FlaA [Yersinia pseudotuberculosis]WLF04523.1 flagellin [Yersinia pseudotuberculosis]